MPTPSMHKMAFPIETEEAYKFWASRHICNRVKAIISFSLNQEDAMHNLRRFGFPYHIRKRAWNAWQNFVALPAMNKIEFTPLGINWWDCMPATPVDPPTGRWVKWDDTHNWLDTNNWVEWIEDIDRTGETKNDDTTGNDSEKADS